MIFFSEQSQRVPLPESQKDTDKISDIARMHGCRVLEFPANYEEQNLTFGDILSYVPHFDEPEVAYYNGFIPSSDRYVEVFEAAKQKNIHLLNSPAESLCALTFEQWYPLLGELTPKSAVIEDAAEVRAAICEIGLPVFIKGSVKSLKHKGLASCVASDVEAAELIATELFDSEFRSRGKVILRRWEVLRHVRTSDLGMPLGREYRVFTYNGNVLESGYYWDGTDALASLNEAEEAEVRQLALVASKRLGAPYAILDIGQREADNEWIVVEAGDGQFAGLSRVDPIPLLAKLIRLASAK